ncbi:MAG: C40 family peptidase [Gallionella sp.]|nr:C40 family peptidase [Gallionella sp.]
MSRLYPLIFALLLTACASSTRMPEQTDNRQPANEVVLYALSLADTPYRPGGNSRESGFDCSGFVQHVFENTAGLKLPRTSAEISGVGETLSASELRPGDLVFFNTRKRPYSHVGIYVGDDRFVHSPSSGKSVAVVNMRESYWRNRYNGARRILATRD